MGVTTAFAVGEYDDKWCNTSGMSCSTTSPAATYQSESFKPADDHGIRPAMMLAAASVDDAKKLIDRGVASDATFPGGKGWLVRTTDKARSVRFADFRSLPAAWSHPGGLELEYQDAVDGSGTNTVENENDILFYFTGLAKVAGIATNTYRPGAVADHLTSFGGRVPTSGQMSILRWLEAGATGSYGTVVEPCNYQSKFPRISVLLPFYFRGGTLLESYWKSVAWPGEGLFVGEPLARPWGTQTEFKNGELIIKTTRMKPGTAYAVEGSATESGGYVELQQLMPTKHELATITISPLNHAYYRLVAR